MGDPEGLARQALEEVAGDRFLGRVADRVDEAVEGRPRLAEAVEQGGDLGVVGDVAVEHQLGAELGGEFAHPLPEALALVAERELGTLAPAGPGDAVGDRPAREHAGDQESLAGEKSHGKRFRNGGRKDSGMRPRRASEGLDRPGDLSLFEGADTIPLFPRKRQVGGSSGPFFLADRLFALFFRRAVR